MLILKNGYWTLYGQKYCELNATAKLVFNLLFEDKKNLIVLHNKNKTITFA